MRESTSNVSFVLSTTDKEKGYSFTNEESLIIGDKTARILIVENDPVLQEMFCWMLALAGYHASIDDTQAIDFARDNAFRLSDLPDLILLDLGIPQKNAALFLQQFRARWRNPPPVIILTASRTLYNQLLGAERVLPKPFRLPELLLEIERALASV